MHRPRLIAQEAFHRIAILVQRAEVPEDLNDLGPPYAEFVLTAVDAQDNLLKRHCSAERVLRPSSRPTVFLVACGHARRRIVSPSAKFDLTVQ